MFFTSRSGASWLFGVPWGIRKVLNYIKDHYNNPPVIVTENGVAEINPAHTKDPERISWLRDYTNNVLKGGWGLACFPRKLSIICRIVQSYYSIGYVIKMLEPIRVMWKFL